MALIRAFEETLLRLFSEGALSGTTHTCIGQEAIAVAIGAHLTEEDLVFSPHRCHGHFIACGGPPELLLAEVMGREAGVCGGRGGSQHLYYKRFYSSGVQGGIVGNAVGAALAEKFFGTDRIAVVFLGDGTLGEGLVYESLNFAALRRLPILFVVEDNRYAQTTPASLAVSGSMCARFEAFGIPAYEIESNDATDLEPVFAERLEYVRRQRSPIAQIVHSYRLGPHSKGDDFRDPEEIEAWRHKDPLVLMQRHLERQEAASLQAEAKAHVARALAFAEESPPASRVAVTQEQFDKDELALPLATHETTFAKSLNGALHRLIEEDVRVFVMGEDLLDPAGGAFAITKGLSTRFPNRVISTPISEAGIVGWATGAALRGARPVVEIMFGDFLSLAADQLLNHASKYRSITGGQAEAPLVVRTPMGGHRGYGPSHSQSIESMFMGVPGLTVVAPSNLVEPGELLRRSVQLAKDPVLFIENKVLYGKRLLVSRDGRVGNFYIRGTSTRYPTLHLSLAEFEPAVLAIITYGGNVPLALEVASTLFIEDEVVADVVVPSLLSPLPVGEILEFVAGCKTIVTVEEGQKSCGWGAEVVAGLSEGQPAISRTYRRFAAARCAIPAARQLEEKVLPGAQYIVETIRGGMV